MRGVHHLAGLADIRTPVSAHTRSAPRHKGTTYLEVLSLGMEKQRLDAEMAWLSRRHGRVERRLQELRQGMGKLLRRVEQDVSPPGTMPSAQPPSPAPGWRSLRIGY